MMLVVGLNTRMSPTRSPTCRLEIRATSPPRLASSRTTVEAVRMLSRVAAVAEFELLGMALRQPHGRPPVSHRQSPIWDKQLIS